MPASWNGTLSIGRSERPTERCPACRGRSSFARIRAHAPCASRLDEARGLLLLTYPRADEPARRARLGAGARPTGSRRSSRESSRPSRSLPERRSRSKGGEMRLRWDASLPAHPAPSRRRADAAAGRPMPSPSRIERFLRDVARRRLSEETRAMRPPRGGIADGPVASATPRAAGAAVRQAARSATTGG